MFASKEGVCNKGDFETVVAGWEEPPFTVTFEFDNVKEAGIFARQDVCFRNVGEVVEVKGFVGLRGYGGEGKQKTE